MRLRLLIGACLLALALGAGPARAKIAGRIPLRAAEVPGNWAGFSLSGSNGYTIEFGGA
jgi:hypothetical protein